MSDVWIIRGTLVAQTPVHVGSVRGGMVDMPVARNGQGRIYVPGTSLAGALRAWCEDHFEADVVRTLWGFVAAGQTDTGRASQLLVRDCDIRMPGDLTVEVRDHVSIDRFSGTAGDRLKFDREVLPRGTEIDIELELASDDLRLHAVVGHMLQAVASDGLRLGGATRRGLGCLDLKGKWRVEHRALSSKASLLARLRGQPGPASDVRQLIAADAGVQPRQVRVMSMTLSWSPESPLMVKAPYEGIAVDGLPLVSGHEGGLALVLPGSSIRGVMRSCADRIMRTLLGSNDSWSPIGAVPLVDELFGTTERAGAVSIRDVYGKPVAAAAWRRVENARTKEELFYGLAEADLAHKVGEHVAIDRWTSAPAEGLLFSSLEPSGVAWDPMLVRVELARLSNERPALSLLAIVLREFAAGHLSFGHGTNRGYGWTRLDSVSTRSPRDNGPWPEAMSRADIIAGAVFAGLQQGWVEYLDGGAA